MFSSLAFCLLLNLVISAMLTGLIWTVQVVHYPSFSLVGQKECLSYQQAHERRIGFLVIPLMLAELGLITWLLNYTFSFDPQTWLKWMAVVCVGLLWLLTATIFAPLHSKLKAEGYSKKYVSRLVRFNWLRTALWTLKTLFLLSLSALYV